MVGWMMTEGSYRLIAPFKSEVCAYCKTAQSSWMSCSCAYFSKDFTEILCHPVSPMRCVASLPLPISLLIQKLEQPKRRPACPDVKKALFVLFASLDRVLMVAILWHCCYFVKCLFCGIM